MGNTYKDAKPVFKPKIYVSKAVERRFARDEIEEELNLWVTASEGGTPSTGTSGVLPHQTSGQQSSRQGGSET